ncbi:MAG: nitroreductase family protein [Clostridiales bacterium]|nr:nitroreductase family protein [Clostridiales bacterium]
MNQTCETLCHRRSVRRFKEDQLLETELQMILQAGMNAPSGMNRQSPIMVVVQDQDTIRKLSAMNAAVMGKDGTDPFYGAPTVVVVLADKEAPTWKEDGSLVMGNLMNAAYSMGVGSCWVHRAGQVFDSPEGQALLREWGIEGNYGGVGHCILGYPDEEKEPLKRKEDYIYRI